MAEIKKWTLHVNLFNMVRFKNRFIIKTVIINFSSSLLVSREGKQIKQSNWLIIRSGCGILISGKG